MVPNMAEFNEVENMMTSFPVFDARIIDYLCTERGGNKKPYEHFARFI